MEAPTDLAALVDASGRNRYLVLCARCPSKVLRPGAARWVDQQHDLPVPKRTRDGVTAATAEDVEPRAVQGFWQVGRHPKANRAAVDAHG